MHSLGRCVVDVCHDPKQDRIVLRVGTGLRGGVTVWTTEVLCGQRVVESDYECIADVFEGTFLSLLKRTVGIQSVLF